MIILMTSNETLTVDACLFIPNGYALVSILQAETDEELAAAGDECAQVVFGPGDDPVVLYFEAVDLDPSGRRLVHGEPNFEMIIKAARDDDAALFDEPNTSEQPLVDEMIPGGRETNTNVKK